MNTLCKRFVEYFGLEIGLSVFATILLTVIVKQASKLFAIEVMLVCLIIHILYIGVRLILQRRHTPKKRYYKINLTVFGVFAIINIIMAILNLEPIYTYLFLPYKIFFILGVNKVKSAVMINLFMLFMISVIPLIVRPYGKKKAKRKKKNKV